MNSPRERILICAATPAEAWACESGLNAGGHNSAFEVLQTGMGGACVRSLTARLADSRLPKPTQVISTGFAGAAGPGIELGSWILATEVKRAGSRPIAVSTALAGVLGRTRLDWSFARLDTVDTIAFQMPAVQDAPKTSGALDMESYLLAEVARGEGVPFGAFRLISDTPDKPIPEAISKFNAGLWMDSALSAVKKPLSLGKFFVRGAALVRVLSDGWGIISRNWEAS